MGATAPTLSQSQSQGAVYLLLTSGKLNSYLADIDRQAEEMFSRLVKQLSEKEGVTETLKAENQMLWVQIGNGFSSLIPEPIAVDVAATEGRLSFLPREVCKICSRQEG